MWPLKINTHLVKECYRRLQYLLPFAELSLMKLSLKLQNLSPLPSCLRQRTDKEKRGDVKGGRRGKTSSVSEHQWAAALLNTIPFAGSQEAAGAYPRCIRVKAVSTPGPATSSSQGPIGAFRALVPCSLAQGYFSSALKVPWHISF